ncbi:hypothetical protein CRENBAI_005111 [Crenichthys baileyi]|uniref:HAT C-terminal dimerisation domain-containing protein n=1 Tax=Crenichthys baileyi TaxID=28760 RepID=A0AAV9RVB9_9TELE
MRSTEAFHSIFEEARNTAINSLVQGSTLPPMRRAPRRYVDGYAPHQFNQPTLHLLMGIEQVVLKAINKAPGSISIPQNVVDSGDVNMEQLSTQLFMFSAVLQEHNSSAERLISRVTKMSTIVDMLAAQGQGTKSLFSEVDMLLRLYLTVPMSNTTAERSFSSLC